MFRTVTDAAVRLEPRRTNVKILLMRRPVFPDREADVAIMAALMRLGFPTTIGALADQVHLPSGQTHEPQVSGHTHPAEAQPTAMTVVCIRFP